MKTNHAKLIGLSALLAFQVSLHAENLLNPGDPIVAVDSIGGPSSAYPRVPDPIAGESVENILDGDSATKYLNFGQEFSGFIITPASGTSVLQSMTFVSANDFPERDPASYILYGTNEAITSEDRSRGDSETWTEISRGVIDLPTDRFAAAPTINVTNGTSYRSYRLVFETLRDTNAVEGYAVQVADIAFFTEADAAGTSIMAPGDPIISIDLDQIISESPERVLDGLTNSKYLNQGGANSGLIVTPAAGSSVVKSLSLTTANDTPDRDPASYILFGTNEAIVSTDNSLGNGEAWTQISAGTLELPEERETTGPIVEIDNDVAYTSYRLVFDTLKSVDPISMQIADLALFTATVAGGQSILAPGDAILAIDLDVASRSRFPANEAPPNAIDGEIGTKYLNFGDQNTGIGGAGTGFVVTPAIGESVLESFVITTANDSDGRDPLTYTISGTNDIISLPENAFVGDEGWEIIQTGTLDLPVERTTVGESVPVVNSQSYTSYKVIFDTLRSGVATEFMQIAEIQFEGTPGSGVASEFTGIDYNAVTDTTTLTWNSVPDRTYTLNYSYDLLVWLQENDNIASGGTSTTYVPTSTETKGREEIFYQLIKN